jgi:hypothetical protein
MPAVNYIAVLAAAVASMVLGFLWYGPLFGKMWMKLMGVKEMGDKSQMPKNYAIVFVGSLVTAYVVSVFLVLTNMTTLTGALTLAFWAWLGFQAPLLVGSVLWEGKSWNLYCLNAVYWLVNLLVIASVLSYLK